MTTQQLKEIVMKKWKIIMVIMGAIYIVSIIIFIILMTYAVVFTIKDNRQDAIFCLLWGIAIDMIFTAIRNIVADIYNHALDKFNNKG